PLAVSIAAVQSSSAANALPIASRTMRRCTPSFLATPVIVPIPNSYSRRICSNSSTLALQSNESPPIWLRPNQSTRSLLDVADLNGQLLIAGARTLPDLEHRLDSTSRA